MIMNKTYKQQQGAALVVGLILLALIFDRI